MNIPPLQNQPLIRRAHPEEAETLCELMVASKASWGYDAAFMEYARGAMSLTSEDIADPRQHTFVIETANAMDTHSEPLGFYRLVEHPDHLWLDDLFIAPAMIGKGYGERLLHHAIETGRALGYTAFAFDSDPNAEPFYRAMGAVKVGERESVIPGRFLPKMQIDF